MTQNTTAIGRSVPNPPQRASLRPFFSRGQQAPVGSLRNPIVITRPDIEAPHHNETRLVRGSSQARLDRLGSKDSYAGCIPRDFFKEEPITITALADNLRVQMSEIDYNQQVDRYDRSCLNGPCKSAFFYATYQLSQLWTAIAATTLLKEFAPDAQSTILASICAALCISFERGESPFYDRRDMTSFITSNGITAPLILGLVGHYINIDVPGTLIDKNTATYLYGLTLVFLALKKAYNNDLRERAPIQTGESTTTCNITLKLLASLTSISAATFVAYFVFQDFFASPEEIFARNITTPTYEQNGKTPLYAPSALLLIAPFMALAKATHQRRQTLDTPALVIKAKVEELNLPNKDEQLRAIDHLKDEFSEGLQSHKTADATLIMGGFLEIGGFFGSIFSVLPVTSTLSFCALRTGFEVMHQNSKFNIYKARHAFWEAACTEQRIVETSTATSYTAGTAVNHV